MFILPGRVGQFTAPQNLPPAVRAAAAASGASPYEITSLDFANQQYWRQGVRSSFAAIPGLVTSGGVNGTRQTAAGIVPATEENLLTWSEDFTNAAWGKVNAGATADQGVAPSGSSEADLLENTSGANAHSRAEQLVSASAGVTYAVSVFMKAGTSNFGAIRVADNATTSIIGIAEFDLSGGTVNATAGTLAGSSIENVGGGWYRCTVRHTVGGGGGSLTAGVYISEGGDIAGSGSQADSDLGDNILIWGAQLRRASTSDTYVKTEGSAITRAAPRINTAGSRGLVVEGAATNLLLRSADLSVSPWGLGDSQTQGAPSPDGGANATLLVEVTDGQNFRAQDATLSVTAGQSYTASIWLRSDNPGDVNLQIARGGAGPVEVNTETVSVTSEWARFSSSITFANNQTGISFRISSVAGGPNEIDAWGAQLEEASTASTYIPTAGSAVTRTADRITFTDLDALGLTSAVLAAGYTVVVEASHSGSTSFYSVWSVSDGSTSNEVYLTAAPSGGDRPAAFMVGGANGGSLLGADGSWPAGETKSVAVRIKENDFALSIDGASAAIDPTADYPTGLSQLNLGARSSVFANGTIKRLTIIPRAVSDAELQALSS
jgi:hypothetical protein